MQEFFLFYCYRTRSVIVATFTIARSLQFTNIKIITILLFLLTHLAFQLNAQNNLASGGNGDDFRTKILVAVHDLRQKGTVCGGEKMLHMYKLTLNVQLESSAAAHANDMAQNNFFNQMSSNGDEVDVRISAAGYNWSAVGKILVWVTKRFRKL